MSKMLAAVAWSLMVAISLPSLIAPQLEAAQMTAKEFEAQLGYETGTITLSGGTATIDLPETFRFIEQEGSRRLLVDAWGNEPAAAEQVLGMLIPSDVSPLAEEGWGIIITFEEEGYINDSDAADIDYTELLEQMQEATIAANDERIEFGFEPVTFVGWAEPPSYNEAAHKLYWAKELSFGDSPEHTLNYNIRILGRRGVLVLNAVAAMGQLDIIRTEAKSVLSAVDFNDGHRYTDYISGDKVASYGITALIAGGAGALAAKTGLLAKFWKLILVGLAAVGAMFKKLFGRFFGKRSGTESEGTAYQG